MRWNSSRLAGQDTSANPPSNQQLGSSLSSASRWGGPSRTGHGDDPEVGHDLSSGNKTSRGARQGTICGVRRKVFFITISAGLLIAVAAIAIGVGAGMAINKTNSQVSPAPSEHGTVDTSKTSATISCPDSNDVGIEVPSDGHFHVSPAASTTPPPPAPTASSPKKPPSMGRCVELCADRDACMGVTWEADECVLTRSVGDVGRRGRDDLGAEG